MIKHDFTVDVEAPIERVFAYTTDFRTFVQWQDGVSQATQIPEGPTQLGTQFTLTRTFLGRRLDASGAVTEFVPNKKCAFQTTSGPIQLSAIQEFEAIPGGTRIRLQIEVEPGGFFKLAEAAMDRQLKSAFESQVHKLKSVLQA